MAGPGLPQHRARRRGSRRAGPDHRDRGRGVRALGRCWPGERINLEFVSANPTGPLHLGGTRWAAVGDSLARILTAQGASVATGVLLQRPRRPDRPVRPVAARRAPRASRRPRTATAAPTSATSPSASLADHPDVLDAARRRGAGGLPARAGVAADVRRDQGEPARLRRRLRRVLPRERRCTSPVRSSTRSRGCASSATSTSRTARSGCAPPSSATTRTGSSSRATASRRTSPATWPTTSTSASAASTGS